jgi:hypothetical protein
LPCLATRKNPVTLYSYNIHLSAIENAQCFQKLGWYTPFYRPYCT